MAVKEPRDEIGIVCQRPTLLLGFDVLNNVTFPMRHAVVAAFVTAERLCAVAQRRLVLWSLPKSER